MEQHLIRHCAPTLAGIKTGGLFGYSFASELVLTDTLRLVNETLRHKGIRAEVLRIRSDNALVYVYRHSMLRRDLAKDDVRSFIERYGYFGSDIGAHLERLKFRLAQQNEFPHEIGLFLGYPLHDVLGFINHRGRNSICTGYWKVYQDENEALKLFARYRKCKDVYTRLFMQGKPFERLIVAA